MTPRMLIAGVGNIFLSDDGFGVEVATRLAAIDLPDWVTVADYGISGMHLAYDVAEGYETTVLVDATPRGEEPGTVYLIELDSAKPPAATPSQPDRGIPLLDGHGMQPDVVLGMLSMLGADAGRMLLVGCEPASTEEGIGLSTPVAAAVDEAVRIVLGLVNAAESGEPADTDARPAGTGGPSVEPECPSVAQHTQPAAGNNRGLATKG
jgi:hydrogenase maturation protease